MKVEIWSDIVCPWCYVGKRHFEKALQHFDQPDDVKIIWRSYELDPSAKKDSGIDSFDHIAAKYGVSREESKQMHDNVTKRAQAAGLVYNMDKVLPTNSFDAHRLVQIAASRGLQDQAMEKLSAAYFTEGKNISDHETLIQTGKELGLDEKMLKDAMTGGSYSAGVRSDEEEARKLGINGVPFFLFERKYAVSGAQPPEVFLQAMEKVREEMLAAEGGVKGV